MSARSKLQTLAKALIAARQPDLLAEVLNTGLNGNRVLRAVVEHREAVIQSRRSPQDAFRTTHAFDDEGRLIRASFAERISGRPAGSKVRALLERAVPLAAVAELERLNGASRALVLAVGQADEETGEYLAASPDAAQRLNRLGAFGGFGRITEAVRSVVRDVPADQIARRMTTFLPHNSLVSVAAEDGRLTLKDGFGTVLAASGDATHAARSVSVVSEHAIWAMFRGAVASLDAEHDLVARAEARETAERAAMIARRQAEYEAKVAQREADEARYVSVWTAQKGEMFAFRPKGDHDILMIAERDLGPEDFLELLRGNAEGLVSLPQIRGFEVGPLEAARLGRLLAKQKAADAGPQPE